MKELVDQAAIKDAFLIHFTDFWAERLVGELPDVIAKQIFIVSQRDQWLGRGSNLGDLGHKMILLRDSGKPKIVSPGKSSQRSALISVWMKMQKS